jgi:hypothetical protein
VVAGGTTALDGGTFELASGWLDGESTFSGSGTFEWSGGELRGNQTIGPAGKMVLTGPADKNIASASTLANDGSVRWTGSGNIRGVGQSRFVNRGDLVAEGDAAFAYYNNGVYPIGVLENTGTIRKIGSDGRTAFTADYGGWRFLNSGMLDIQSGTFDVGPNYEPAATVQTQVAIGGGADGTSHGTLAFPGMANFAGRLLVTVSSNFLPQTNIAFTIATYGGRNGDEQFVSPALPAMKGGSTWKVDYEAAGLRLSIATAASNSNPARTADGKFQMSLSGPPGKYALFQGSSNLVDWFDIQTNQPFSGEFNFLDPQATNTSRFYRTVIIQ